VNTIIEIQKLLKVAPDGVWGPVTESALRAAVAHFSWHKTKASSFADASDLEAFLRCKAKGKSDIECFKVGDNGIGYSGIVTATEAECYAALTRAALEAAWGSLKNAVQRKIEVRCGNKTALGAIGDYMSPDLASGATIDLNPGFAKALGLKPPFIAEVSWRWAEEKV